MHASSAFTDGAHRWQWGCTEGVRFLVWKELEIVGRSWAVQEGRHHPGHILTGRSEHPPN